MPRTPAAERPLHLRGWALGLVFLGGTLGTAARHGLEVVLGTAGPLPAATLAANVSGAFLLGLLLEGLTARGPDGGRLRAARLLLGTGVLGGFTTYSTFAVQSVLLGGPGTTGFAGEVGAALLYGAVSLAAGLLAALLGTAIGSALVRGGLRRRRRLRQRRVRREERP